MKDRRVEGADPESGEPVAAGVAPFRETLLRNGLSLVRDDVRTLQVNTGYLCNLSCRHCHLEAGPVRDEVMTRETMEAVVDFAGRFRFPTIDITGGAPERVPGLPFLIEGLAARTGRLMLRTNLSALAAPEGEALLGLFVQRKVVLIASLPSTDPSQTDAQRGAGAADSAIAMLRRLNAAGYGVEGSGLELSLVANPTGAFLPGPQDQTERKFRRELGNRGIAFSNLYSFANAPLGRFRRWLEESGKYERYLGVLAEGFNPCAVAGLMCRTLLSVSWDGFLFDCDFHLAAGRFLAGRKVHVSKVREIPPPGTPIAVGEYCYACTAGAGFT